MSDKPNKGITLIELLISSLLISAMLGAVWIIFSTAQKAFYGELRRGDIQGQASNAFAVMTNELSQAVSITAASGTAITFTADTNNDGVNETIQYSWSGVSLAPLNRVVSGLTMQLVRSVSNSPPDTYPLFNYFGANNTALGTTPVLANIRLVQIELYSTGGSETFHLRTKVYLRAI
jgi:Tfp pilus assembly protein PilV